MSYIKDDVSAKRKIGMVLTYAVLILFAILAIAPLLWLAINSFKTSQDYQMNRLGLPRRFFWQNYTQAWQRGHFGVYIVNSVIYTAITTVSILILSFLSGFAFAKINNRNTKWIYGSYVVGILMTLQSIMIPLFIVINQVGLYDTKLGVLIPYVGIGLPMGIYLATEFMKSIPNALIESARLDGAKYSRIFISIMAPMAAPVGTTIAILQISGSHEAPANYRQLAIFCISAAVYVSTGCIYKSLVIFMELWPKTVCSVFVFMPALFAEVANVCRNAWNVKAAGTDPRACMSVLMRFISAFSAE